MCLYVRCKVGNKVSPGEAYRTYGFTNLRDGRIWCEFSAGHGTFRKREIDKPADFTARPALLGRLCAEKRMGGWCAYGGKDRISASGIAAELQRTVNVAPPGSIYR